MAIRSRDELLGQIRTIIGDNHDDASIALIEDVTDTVTDLETRAADNTNWHEKYTQLDNDWREKYKKRFFEGDPGQTEPPATGGEETVITSFEDLFKTE